MIRMYANENFPQGVVQLLRDYGHDVLTVLEAGNANVGISHADVLAFAISNQRVVITLNRRDFIQLHIHFQNTHQEHFGIIVCTQDSDIVGQAENINRAISTGDTLFNHLLRVNRRQV